MALKKYHVSPNLFDPNLTRYHMGKGSSNNIAAVANGAMFYIGAMPNTQYSIKVYTNDSTFVRLYLSNAPVEQNVVTAYSEISESETTTNPTVTITNTNYNYLWIQVGGTWYTNHGGTSIMLNEGDTALPLEPYGNTWVDSSYRRYETATDVVTSLPVKVYGDGETDISLLLKGNTQTSGTPTPSNPVIPNGCGERTANLFNIAQPIDAPQRSYIYNGDFSFQGEKITFKFTFYCSLALVDNNDSEIINLTVSADSALTVSTPNGIKSMRIYTNSGVTDGYIMINDGSTALPYEPYGYKILISKDLSPLTPIYLGNVQTTRKIVKFVLDGTEDWEYVTATNGYARLIIGTINQYMSNLILCTHLEQAQITTSTTDIGCNVSNPASKNASVVVLRLSGISPSVEAYKSFLAEQYAAGTPVTVWVVLTNAITSTVNEPLMKIDEYADSIDSTQAGVTIPTTGGTATIDVDTTVKPSELNLTYHGWHEHQPLKRENGQWE